ncbi:hypothetical protein [uncultured Methanobrevibacter sp.]|uniref:hypothetical protein n=1 Tax=uncultured Methanobrevibacter sp. TaxID=253161 RepID=UPI0025CCB206|nr:hypothetical protein [uncultured Methanobrevibacter sp.]
MTDSNIDEFMKSYSRWTMIENNIRDIVLKYDHEIKFYNPQSIHVNLHENQIVVQIDTGEIPFRLIKELNKYFGKDCNKISVSVGHHINLHYKF